MWERDESNAPFFWAAFNLQDELEKMWLLFICKLLNRLNEG